MASRSLQNLHPDMQTLAKQFLAECVKQEIYVLIYCTYRSNEEQDYLYKQGRTIAGKIVTNAKGGQSKHNFTAPDGTPMSKAFDCVPTVNGSLDWFGRGGAWQKMGDIWVKMGHVWGGNFKSVDRPHFEMKD